MASPSSVNLQDRLSIGSKKLPMLHLLLTTSVETCVIIRFTPKLAKPIIDEIDRVLAQHYGFTDEELDFIINYDIKSRIRRDG